MKRRVFAIVLIVISCFMLCSCKSKNAAAADKLIKKIGEVSLESESSIKKAEDAVNALSEEEYSELENLEQLETAKETFKELEEEHRAVEVKEAINAIGEVTLDSKEDIQRARSLYGYCREKYRKDIDNYDVLVKDEERLRELMVENVIKEIDSIGSVTLDSEKNISRVQSLYNELKSEDREKVTNIDTLNNAYETLKNLRIEESRKEQEARAAVLNAKKDKKIIETNGKQIWQVVAKKEYISFWGDYKGSGNFIIEILDDNQDFFDLVVNEIGDYHLNKSVDGLTPERMYYIQIEWSHGGWSLSWSGTYGD